MSRHLELHPPVRDEELDAWQAQAGGYRDLLQAAIEELDNACFATTGRRSTRARQLRGLLNIVDRWNAA